MKYPDGFYAYMTISTADRSDASTWGSRQPPPSCTCLRKDDHDTMTAFTSGSDVRTDDTPRTATLSRREVLARAAAGAASIAAATALPTIPEALAVAPPCTRPGRP